MDCNLAEKNGTLTITIAGQLIFSDTAPFAGILGQIRKAGVGSCLVDLSRLDHIDSSGLRMLLLVYDACRAAGAMLEFRGSKGQVRDMLLHCRFETIVTITG